MMNLLKEDFKVFQKKHGKGLGPILYYPMLTALIFYRCSCFLYQFKILRPFSYIFVRINDFFHGIWIGQRVVAGPGLFLGHARGLIINLETKIGHHCTILHRVTIGGPGIVIGNDVTIGANATIISRRSRENGLLIGDNVVVGAGAVVIKDIPDNAVVAGNPSVILKFKNDNK